MLHLAICLVVCAPPRNKLPTAAPLQAPEHYCGNKEANKANCTVQHELFCYYPDPSTYYYECNEYGDKVLVAPCADDPSLYLSWDFECLR